MTFISFIYILEFFMDSSSNSYLRMECFGPPEYVVESSIFASVFRWYNQQNITLSDVIRHGIDAD
jgi:hypothetical protein